MFNFFRKNNISKSGFSLVEMLVAVAIFMSIMTVAITSLISIIAATKKAQAIKSTIDSVNFAIENISKDMRIGYGYWCSADGSSFLPTKDCLSGGPAVRYVNSSNQTITYKFSTSTDSSGAPYSVLTRLSVPCTPGGATSCTDDIISKDANVNITNMNFYVIGADNEFAAMPSKTQPRVIITASGLISVKGSPDTTFDLQTNISQRVRR